ncbi:MAG TPA: hypothetical protein VIG08_06250 [Gemmatimonadales bacterium]|jgi:hypothetical protein
MLARLSPALAVALLALPGCGGPKPAAPVVRLGAPTDSLITSFRDVSEAAWLGGDRWAVLTPGDDAAAIADLASHKVERLGGRGAEEIRNAAGLFRAGDTLFVNDWGLRRTTLWTLEGRAAGAMPASDKLRGVLPRARDDSGRFYYEIAPRPGADGQGNRDSSVVVRAGPGADKADTVARLAPLDLAEVVGDAGRRFERRVFSGADRWGIVPDGAVWVARVYENRVLWRDPGGNWLRGEPLPDRVLEVTRYDREMFLRNYPPELRSTAEQLPFAAVKPPFEAGFTAPHGEVWLEKSRAPIDSTRRYHVVDTLGRLRREIHVPGRGRIVAIGDGTVLVAAPSRDGAHLLRFMVPPEAAPQ